MEIRTKVLMKTLLLQRLLPIVFVLAYLLLPIDLVPDFLGPLGRGDDIVLLGLLVWYLMSERNLMDFLGRILRREPDRRGRPERNLGPDSEHFKEETDPYGILRVDTHAPIEEVQRAYRRQVAKYHPDRVSHLGEEFQELAHQKFVRIQKAYEWILQHRTGGSHRGDKEKSE
jgi:hypothetical protein